MQKKDDQTEIKVARNKRTVIPKQPGSKYTDEDRRRAVIEYCVHGTMSKVAKITSIPDTTLAHWKNKSDWWDTLVAEVRNEISDHILAQNMEIATKAGERVLDSLENGDEKLIWDKAKSEHVIKRVKPTGKDASVMGGIAQDKARVQLNLPTSISSNQSSEEAIQALAKEFEKLSEQHKLKDVVSDQ